LIKKDVKGRYALGAVLPFFFFPFFFFAFFPFFVFFDEHHCILHLTNNLSKVYLAPERFKR
jgi:cytochrome c biogenesis protein CcdA